MQKQEEKERQWMRETEDARRPGRWWQMENNVQIDSNKQVIKNGN